MTSALSQKWVFTEMTEADADAILAWHYEGDYAFYDLSSDPEDAAEFIDSSRWRLRDLEGEREVMLAVKNERDELAGFFAFAGSPELCTIGLGLAPELTGQGLGPGFIAAGLAFGRKQWMPARFRLEVAAFNERAIKAYERLGFVQTRRFVRELSGKPIEFVEMVAESEALVSVDVLDGP